MIYFYKKIIPEKIRIRIRNIQYRLHHLIFKINFFIKKNSKKNKNLNGEIKFNDKKKPSVFYIIPTTKITGGVAVCCEHLNRLKKRGFEVLFASYDNKTDLSWFPNQKVKIVPLNKWKKELEKFDIGVATGWITAYELSLINVKRKIYFVQSDERKFYPKESFLRKRVEETYKMQFEFMTEAIWIKKLLKDKFKKKAYYIPNGINTNIFHPSKPLIPNKKNIIRFLVEGPSDLDFKRVEESIELLNEIKNEYKSLEIAYVNNNGKPNKKLLCDYYFENIPMLKMKNIYSSCDFLLKLSKVEGFSGPILEMIACGGKSIIDKNLFIEEFTTDKFLIERIFTLKEKNRKGKIIQIIKKFKNAKKDKKGYYLEKKMNSLFNWETTVDKLQNFFLKNV